MDDDERCWSWRWCESVVSCHRDHGEREPAAEDNIPEIRVEVDADKFQPPQRIRQDSKRLRPAADMLSELGLGGRQFSRGRDVSAAMRPTSRV